MKDFVDLIECNISQNNHITQNVQASIFCVIAFVAVGQNICRPLFYWILPCAMPSGIFEPSISFVCQVRGWWGNCAVLTKYAWNFPAWSCAKTNHAHLGQRRYGMLTSHQTCLLRDMNETILLTKANSTCVTHLGNLLVPPELAVVMAKLVTFH